MMTASELRHARRVILEKTHVRAVGAYAGATALCLLSLVWVMKLCRADLTIPFSYGGDGLLVSGLIKGLLDNKWYFHNRFVGMPTGLDQHDFPMPENLHYLLMKLMSLWTSDFALVMNLYFLMTFPLTAITSLVVFRRFNLSYPPAIVGSLLYALLPYHFFRGEPHLFLASYYLIPPMVMVVLWIWGEEPLFRSANDNHNLLSAWASSRVIASIVICVLVASAGIYYAFFAGFFLLVAGVFAFCHQRSRRQLLASGVLLAVLFLAFLANVSPHLIYAYRHGKNPVAFARSPVESEIYGMKVIQLVLPVTGHRIPYVANKKEKYNRSPLVNENDAASLGAVGSCGFLLLLWWLIFRRPEAGRADLFRNLAVLNLSAVLLATIGGFGVVFASAVSANIRAYNRMSIYIAFFSIFAVTLFLEELVQRWATSKCGRCLVYSVLGLILLGGTLDQTTAHFVPPYPQLKAEYLNDADFVKRIEASVPQYAMIFQLPYVPFPANPPVHRMSDYSLFRGYLHSKTLRWSYGAMKGRVGDTWQRQVVAKPLAELVATLVLAGFSGIYVDRYGFAENGADLEAKLSSLLKTAPILAANQRLVFFNLENAASKPRKE